MLFRGSRWDNERLSIWNGCFAMVTMSIVGNFVAMYLIDALHASDNEVALLNSLPALMNLFAMPAAAFALRFAGSKRNFCSGATIISRTFSIWIALVPLLPIHNPAIWVVWLVALTRLPQSFGDLSWQALMADLIAPERRSPFFSDRNRATTIIGLIATLSTGYFLQQFDKSLKWPYQLAFVITVVFAFLEIYSLLRHDESGVVQEHAERDANPLQQLLLTLKDALRDQRFRLAALTMLIFNFGWQLAWPLFNLYQIGTANAPQLWMSLFAVANSGSQFVTYRWWGRMAERFGNVRMLAFAAMGMATAPVLTVASSNMYYLFIVNIVTGIPVAGTTLLLFNYLLEVCPTERRTSYIAVYNVALSVIGFLAPETGVWLLGRVGMGWAMIASALLRFGGGICFLIVAVWLKSRRWSISSINELQA